MNKLSLTLLTIFISITGVAYTSNFYVHAFGGWNAVNSETQDNARLSTTAGSVVGGSLGYRFSNFFKLEGEVAYRSNLFDYLKIDRQYLSVSGEIKKFTAFGNGLCELRLFSSPFVPYIGCGIGHRWDREDLQINPICIEEGVYQIFPKIKSKGHGPALQGIFGLIISRSKRLEATAEYRYLDGPYFQPNHTLDISLKRSF